MNKFWYLYFTILTLVFISAIIGNIPEQSMTIIEIPAKTVPGYMIP